MSEKIPPLLGIARGSDFKLPAPGKARWVDVAVGEPILDERLTLGTEVVYDRAVDSDGNVGIVLGVRQPGGAVVTGLSLDDAMELLEWLSDCTARLSAVHGNADNARKLMSMIYRMAKDLSEAREMAQFFKIDEPAERQ